MLNDVFKILETMISMRDGVIPKHLTNVIMINNCIMNQRKTGNTINQAVPKRFLGVNSAGEFKVLFQQRMATTKYKFPALTSPSIVKDISKIQEFLANPERNLTRKTAKGQIVKDWHSIAFSIFLELDEVISVAELKALSKAS